MSETNGEPTGTFDRHHRRAWDFAREEIGGAWLQQLGARDHFTVLLKPQERDRLITIWTATMGEGMTLAEAPDKPGHFFVNVSIDALIRLKEDPQKLAAMRGRQNTIKDRIAAPAPHITAAELETIMVPNATNPHMATETLAAILERNPDNSHEIPGFLAKITGTRSTDWNRVPAAAGGAPSYCWINNNPTDVERIEQALSEIRIGYDKDPGTKALSVGENILNEALRRESREVAENLPPRN